MPSVLLTTLSVSISLAHHAIRPQDHQLNLVQHIEEATVAHTGSVSWGVERTLRGICMFSRRGLNQWWTSKCNKSIPGKYGNEK